MRRRCARAHRLAAQQRYSRPTETGFDQRVQIRGNALPQEHVSLGRRK